MKDFILSCILYVVRFGMSFVYFFIKLFPVKKNKITMLSRQSNNINIDFEMLLDEIQKNYKEMQVKVLCKKIPQSFIGKIGYCFFIVKCLYHIATSKVCIIDGYVIPISSLRHKKSLIVIQIWHAMGAIKQFGKQVLDKSEGSSKTIANIMKMHQNYTNVMCVSETTKKIFAKAFGIEENKILTLGMPRIDYLLGKDGIISQKVEKLYQDYPNLKEKETILYVPTFRKERSTHIYDVIHAIDTKRYNLIIKLHPLDETKIDGRYTVESSYQTFELLKIADYVITDYSAVAFEACVIDKPILFYLYDIEEYQENRGLNIDLQEEMPHSTFSDINEIMQIIDNKQYYWDELKKFKEKYIETIDTKNTMRIVKYISQIM